LSDAKKSFVGAGYPQKAVEKKVVKRKGKGRISLFFKGFFSKLKTFFSRKRNIIIVSISVAVLLGVLAFFFLF
jgi:hypothetical protein